MMPFNRSIWNNFSTLTVSSLGINKINISSDIKVAYHAKMREVLADSGLREPNSIQPPCIAAMKETAAHKIDLFAAAGAADHS